jgi:hypothetical protein
MSTLFRWWAALLFVAIVVQVGLAGVGAFRVSKLAHDAGTARKHNVEDFWGPHGVVGTILIVAALLLVVFAAIGWRPELRRSGILFGLTILQLLLALLGHWKGALGFFHPVNALSIFALSGLIAHRAWRTSGSTTPRRMA